MNPQVPDIPLRDIHLPDSVSWWPIAPGWWIMLLLLISAALVVLVFKKIREHEQLKNQSMAEFSRLVECYRRDGDSQELLSEISQLLRRISITQYEDRNVAGLTGDAWLEFLDEALVNYDNERELCFKGELGRSLTTGQYRKKGSLDNNSLDNKKLDELLVLTKAWLHVVCRRPRRASKWNALNILQGNR